MGLRRSFETAFNIFGSFPKNLILLISEQTKLAVVSSLKLSYFELLFRKKSSFILVRIRTHSRLYEDVLSEKKKIISRKTKREILLEKI